MRSTSSPTSRPFRLQPSGYPLPAPLLDPRLHPHESSRSEFVLKGRKYSLSSKTQNLCMPCASSSALRPFRMQLSSYSLPAPMPNPWPSPHKGPRPQFILKVSTALHGSNTQSLHLCSTSSSAQRPFRMQLLSYSLPAPVLNPRLRLHENSELHFALAP